MNAWQAQVAPFPRSSTTVVFKDNVRTSNLEHEARINASGIIPAFRAMAQRAREKGLPIVWIRVERRVDRMDALDALTDVYLANGRRPGPRVGAGERRSSQPGRVAGQGGGLHHATTRSSARTWIYDSGPWASKPY